MAPDATLRFPLAAESEVSLEPFSDVSVAFSLPDAELGVAALFPVVTDTPVAWEPPGPTTTVVDEATLTVKEVAFP